MTIKVNKIYAEYKNEGKMDRQTITYLADLGKLNFSPEDADKMAEDMTGIIQIMDTVKEIDITYDPFKDNHNVFLGGLREDVKYDSYPREEMLSNAPASSEGYFSVPKVVE
jgi:aspartyl-tRNA(Asn)/glutamyl-tRNA(Gln) amidotransferase subunit C